MGKVGKFKNRWVIWLEICNYLSELKRNVSWEFFGWIKKEILEVKKKILRLKWRYEINEDMI